MDTAQAVKLDRERRKLSRTAYAELIGDLTAAKIGNIERGRKLKDGEEEALRPYIADLLAQDALPFTEAPTPEPESEQPTPPTDDYEERKRKIIDAYRAVMVRMGGKPAPYGYPFACARPDAAGPEELDRIAAWIVQCNDWADRRDAGQEPEVVEGESPPPDEELDEDEHLAIVTDPEAPPESWLPDPTLRYVTNGELRTFKECQRKWWLGHYRRLARPREGVTGPAPLGTRVHKALSVLYVPDGQDRGNPLAELEKSISEDLERVADDPVLTDELRKDADLARAMVEGYLEWIAETGVDQGLTITASEQRVEADPRIEEVPNARLLAKLDVRAVRDVDDARLFIDHKTVGNLTEPVKTLHMDEQMLHYHLVEYLDLLAAGQQDQRSIGVLYNMLRKVKRTAQANPPFYGRVEVQHNLDTLRSYWLRVRGTILQIIEAEQRLAAGVDHRQAVPPHPTRDCTWKCEFFAVCPMFDDGSRAEDFVRDNLVEVNPLQRYETTGVTE